MQLLKERLMIKLINSWISLSPKSWLHHQTKSHGSAGFKSYSRKAIFQRSSTFACSFLSKDTCQLRLLNSKGRQFASEIGSRSHQVLNRDRRYHHYLLDADRVKRLEVKQQGTTTNGPRVAGRNCISRRPRHLISSHLARKIQSTNLLIIQLLGRASQEVSLPSEGWMLMARCWFTTQKTR